ncbi:hypothetical protein IW262DRAFT_1454445 [Armillaria fumosa]|nr:hypothetical protein IW262DRAFT_1454445 [Armillaria fumosa]
MKSTVEWLRRDCADAAACVSGRVTPALLANVRVQGQKLEQVATVGIRDGSMLVVTVFEEDNLKYVEAAIYDAKIPSITPQRQDTRTLRSQCPNRRSMPSNQTSLLWAKDGGATSYVLRKEGCVHSDISLHSYDDSLAVQVSWFDCNSPRTYPTMLVFEVKIFSYGLSFVLS